MDNVIKNIIGKDISLAELFEENRSVIESHSSPVLNSFRDEAFDAFQELGIPSNKVENYKYTNLQPLFSGDFTFSLKPETLTENLEDIFSCDVDTLDSITVYLVNGWYYTRNNPGDLPKGVVIGSMAQVAKENPELIEKYYGIRAPHLSDGAVAFNTMFAQDGFFVYVPKGVVVEKPIQIVNILMSEDALMTTQRNLVVMEDNSEARIMVCDHTLTTGKFVMNNVTEGYVGRDAKLDLYNLQNQHNATTQVAGFYFEQHENSHLATNNLTLHAGVARNNIELKLAGSHAEGHAYGLYLLDKNQHVDNFSYIDHAVPDCFSDELFKGVLDDHSTGAFTGKIMVRPDAQKTNAYQSNNNLLLTNDAKMNTKPQLEIYADDVKCSHGATVGQIDEDAMFYLRTRGINKNEATILLMYAFAYEVIEKIKVVPLREQIRTLVEKRFRGELDKCHSCVVCGQKGTDVTCL
ncbi:Fe-S cluster assembly protein SufD [Marinilabilia salmonicolor]|uniref:Fe-S cluster assembly protein SufD n=1 Tax=Marinilabilia salmonicolor TaxID=989 RepID=A0A368VAP9_9BACT|nr:Fe-S cluster assembly protein SufD [Marinilabilia salmonicolor]RCW37390.1 Fe-S cluster assembly protein SufD [Marinilabilia salmonicolor]